MPENDIYNSKKTYERFKNNLDRITEKNNKLNSEYYCKNKEKILTIQRGDNLYCEKCRARYDIYKLDELLKSQK